VTSALVALTQPHQGHRRVILTYPALARASPLLCLVGGPHKKDPLGKLLAVDQSIPAGRVRTAHSLVLADAAAT
jgi:6-phosphogluconolactonase